MSRLLRHAAVFFAAAAGLLLGAGCGKREAAPVTTPGGLLRVRMHLDWYPQTEYGGYFQADARGFYREAGLAVEIVPGGPGVPVKDTVALERAEFGCTDGNDVIVAISKGLPLVIVAAEMQRNPQGLLFHREHPLTAFGDLDGRTLMAGPGSAWVEYLQKSLGVRFDLLPLVTDLTSFLADPAMVRQCFVTQEPHFAERKGARVGTLLIAESGYDPYRVIFTSREFLVRNPEAVRRFLVASARGFDDLLEGDPAPAFGALARVNPLMTPEIMDYSLSVMKSMRLVQGDLSRGERTGLITRDRITRQIEVLQSLGLLGRRVTAEDVAVFDLMPGPETGL